MLVRKCLSVAIPLALVISANACSDIGISPTSTTVRFVNAIPGANLLSFTSSTGFPVNNIQYQGYSQCETMTAGTVTFTFGGNGTSVPSTQMNPVTLFGGGKYTILAYGNPSAPSSLFLPDTFSAAPSGQNARLRIVDLVSSSGNVDVYVGAPNSALVAPVATNIASGSVAYITVPAEQGLQVWLTTTQTTSIVATTDPNQPLTFPVGDEETLFFIDGTGGSSALWFVVPQCP